MLLERFKISGVSVKKALKRHLFYCYWPFYLRGKTNVANTNNNSLSLSDIVSAAKSKSKKKSSSVKIKASKDAANLSYHCNHHPHRVKISHYHVIRLQLLLNDGTWSRPNILPQALEIAAIFAMIGRLWMTKETSFFWIRARFWACPRSPYLQWQKWG